MRTLGAPDGNNQNRLGREAFAEFHDLFRIERQFAELKNPYGADYSASR